MTTLGVTGNDNGDTDSCGIDYNPAKEELTTLRMTGNDDDTDNCGIEYNSAK